MKRFITVMAIVCSLVLVGCGIAVAYYNYTLWGYGVSMYLISAFQIFTGCFSLYIHFNYLKND